nr:probable E3 ubiquitin-protein ligase RNF144A-B [Ipomoea trifida]
MNCLLYTQRTTLTRETDGTTMMKAISVEDYKSKSVIMVAESSGYGMNRVVIELSQSQGTLGVPRVVIDLTQDNPDDEIQILEVIMPAPARIKPECSNSKPVYIDVEDAMETSASLFICEICCDAKQISDIFIIKACKHSYFSDCISKFVASKLQQNVPQINCPFSGCTGWWSLIAAARFCRLKCLIVGGTRYVRLWCWLLKNFIAPSKAMDEDGSLKLRQSGDSDNNNRSAPDFVTPSPEEGEREQREGSRKNVEISIEEARPLDTNAGGNGWKYDLNRIATIPLPWSYAGAKNSGPSPQGSGHVPVPPGKNSGPSPQGSGHVPVPPMKNSGPSPQGSGHVPVPPMKNSGPSPQGSGHVPVPPVEFH